jgi:hypothetical protein
MHNGKQGLCHYFGLPNTLVFQLMVGCCFGGVIGLASLWLSPLIVLGVLVTFFFTYAVIKRPEIALLGILIATSSIVFEEQLPLITIGISLHLSDILLLGLLGMIAVRWLIQPQFKIVHTPLNWPLLLFIGVTMLSTCIAIYQGSVDVVDVRRAIRILAYYLTFFIVTNLIRERRQLDLLLNGIYFLAIIVALTMVAQFILGDAVKIIPGRVETLQTRGILYENITRILPPGWCLVLVSLIATICLLVFERRNLFTWLRFSECGLFCLAILVTFLRSYWAVLVLVFVLLGYLLRGENRQRLIRGGGWMIVVAAICLLIIFLRPDSRAAKLVSASLDRLTTLGQSGTFQGEDSSFDWRRIENKYAISTIAANPLFGLGMGFTYRPWDRRLDLSMDPLLYDFRKHIHNGHYWILLQSGLIGYLSFAWLSFTFLRRGFRYWKEINNVPLRSVVLGFTLVYLAVFIAAVANSSFMQWRWTPVLGIIFGANEVIYMKFGREV